MKNLSLLSLTMISMLLTAPLSQAQSYYGPGGMVVQGHDGSTTSVYGSNVVTSAPVTKPNPYGGYVPNTHIPSQYGEPNTSLESAEQMSPGQKMRIAQAWAECMKVMIPAGIDEEKVCLPPSWFNDDQIAELRAYAHRLYDKK